MSGDDNIFWAYPFVGAWALEAMFNGMDELVNDTIPGVVDDIE